MRYFGEDIIKNTSRDGEEKRKGQLIFVSSFKSRLIYIEYNQTVFEPFSKARLVQIKILLLKHRKRHTQPATPLHTRHSQPRCK
jgi:hypothetical protein